jgi:hypothetical protein
MCTNMSRVWSMERVKCFVSGEMHSLSNIKCDRRINSNWRSQSKHHISQNSEAWLTCLTSTHIYSFQCSVQTACLALNLLTYLLTHSLTHSLAVQPSDSYSRHNYSCPFFSSDSLLSRSLNLHLLQILLYILQPSLNLGLPLLLLPPSLLSYILLTVLP